MSEELKNPAETESSAAMVSSSQQPTPKQQQQPAQQQPVSREELMELVRAIKFAKPEASMRSVHREISQELSQRESFGFLRDVQLGDVKRVWKKAQSGATSTTATTTTTTSNSASTSLASALPSTQVVQLYTVGDASVRTLAHEYSEEAAAAVAARQQEEMDSARKYVHVFLDQPADRSGARPHQALISFQTSKQQRQRQDGKQMDAREIVKIQMAAADSHDTTNYPMLLYNADRSAKTFVHPDPETDGYERIQDWIHKEGIGGALGTVGGSKAYFYSYLTKQKKGPDVLSIDVSQLAPAQPW